MISTGFRYVSFAVLLAGFLGFMLLTPQAEARGRLGGGHYARAGGARAGGATGFRGGGVAGGSMSRSGAGGAYAGRTFHGGDREHEPELFRECQPQL